MAFRGWFLLNGQEVSNTSRLLSHIRPQVPEHDDDVATALECACEVVVPYDDSWTGLRAEVGDAPYVLVRSPGYNAARPASADFACVWVMEVDGFGPIPVQREVSDAICVGGVPSLARDTARPLTFSALVVACTNAGAEYGLDWLSCVLRQANARGGLDLEFFKAHLEDTGETAATLRRAYFGVVLTQPPTVVETSGGSEGRANRQAPIDRGGGEMVATNPYAYGASTLLPVTWDSETEEAITWAHAPDCSDTSSCGLPTIYNADCLPPDDPLTPAVIPTCGGCLPICSIEKRTWELPTQLGNCDDTVVTVRVTNNGADPLTVIMYWQPCGSTDPCERTGQLQVSGLPTDHTVVADSVTGRPYVAVDNVAHRQVGIVSTPNGAPWRPTTLDAMLCWELVAESAPGVDYTVTIELKDRDA